MIDPRREEDAALDALGLLDESARAQLQREAAHDPEVARALRDFAATAALLAYDTRQVDPPAALRERIMAGIEEPVREARPEAKIIPFWTWAMPYAIAACLMALVLVQMAVIGRLRHSLNQEEYAVAKLQADDSMLQLRIADLKAMNANFINAKVMVAWDPVRHRGVITMANLPAPPPGHDYQLWVLDPTAQAPLSAGMLTSGAQAQGFAARRVNSMDPGFAISMEPTGGRTQPTPGQILFAVAAAR
jgi:anti-sigma-K factor RskA